MNTCGGGGAERGWRVEEARLNICRAEAGLVLACHLNFFCLWQHASRQGFQHKILTSEFWETSYLVCGFSDLL